MWAGSVHVPEVASGQDLADQSRSHQEPPWRPARRGQGAGGRVTGEETQGSSKDEQRACVGRATAMRVGGCHSQDSQSSRALGLGTVPRDPPRDMVPPNPVPTSSLAVPSQGLCPHPTRVCPEHRPGYVGVPKGSRSGHTLCSSQVGAGLSESFPESAPSHPKMPLSYKMAESGPGWLGWERA